MGDRASGERVSAMEPLPRGYKEKLKPTKDCRAGNVGKFACPTCGMKSSDGKPSIPYLTEEDAKACCPLGQPYKHAKRPKPKLNEWQRSKVCEMVETGCTTREIRIFLGVPFKWIQSPVRSTLDRLCKASGVECRIDMRKTLYAARKKREEDNGK